MNLLTNQKNLLTIHLKTGCGLPDLDGGNEEKTKSDMKRKTDALIEKNKIVKPAWLTKIKKKLEERGEKLKKNIK